MQLDRALPGTHTRRLYGSLKRDEAQIVAQLRTEQNRLNSALYRINAVDSDLCEWCQRPETVRHYLWSARYGHIALVHSQQLNCHMF